MAELLTPNDLCEGLKNLFQVNPIFAGKKLHVFVIANERAGGFTQVKQSEKNRQILKKILDSVHNKEVAAQSVTLELLVTKSSGHGKLLAVEIAKKASKDFLTVIVSAGGDGTSLEVQTGLTKWALESEKNRDTVMNDILVYRLPLGTGNDGTDGHTFEESLGRLTKPLHFANAKAVKFSVNSEVSENGIKSAGMNPADYGDVTEKSPWYAFNIAGLGLDAFVCWKTNQEKTKHPGNYYQLMVDFATLNYNKLFPPEKAEIQIFDGDKLLEKVDSPFEMLTFGVSGHRTFGSGKKIFPADENAAVIGKLDVIKMVKNSPKFNDGSYIKTNIAKTYCATKMILNYEHPVLCELDGETHLLLKENFPITLELTEPCIQVLECDDLEYGRGTVKK